MNFIETIQDFILQNPVETLLIVALSISLPFFAYYIFKKKMPAYRLYKGFKKPKKFQYDLISIGPEGTPFVTGFIKNNPKSKIIIVKSTKANKAQSQLSPADVARSSIDFLSGEPKLISPYEVSLNGKIITSENILIATGAAPNIPDFIGLEKVQYFTPHTIWMLNEAPKKLLILGDNNEACEFAQTYVDRESEVTLATSQARLLSNEEPHVGQYVFENLQRQKVNILLNARLEKFERLQAQAIAIFDKDDQDVLVEFDAVLFCLGDVPNTAGIGLEKLAIPLNPNGSIKVDWQLRTNYPTIFACGRAAGIQD